MTQLGKKQSNGIFDISIAGLIDMKLIFLINVESALALICYSHLFRFKIESEANIDKMRSESLSLED